MGHEFTGIVTEVGSAVQTVRLGDTVVSPFTVSWYVCLVEPGASLGPGGVARDGANMTASSMRCFYVCYFLSAAVLPSFCRRPWRRGLHLGGCARR